MNKPQRTQMRAREKAGSLSATFKAYHMLQGIAEAHTLDSQQTAGFTGVCVW